MFSSEVVKHCHRPSASRTDVTWNCSFVLVWHKNDFRKRSLMFSFTSDVNLPTSNSADRTQIHIHQIYFNLRPHGGVSLIVSHCCGWVSTGVHLIESVKETSCVYMTHRVTWQNDITSAAWSLALRFNAFYKHFMKRCCCAVVWITRKVRVQVWTGRMWNSHQKCLTCYKKKYNRSPLEVRIYNF